MDRCWFCGTTQNLHIHEAFFGTANRKKSIEWGLYVMVCAKHHNMGNKCVHNNYEMDMQLKKEAQRSFEKIHGHAKFMRIFHKNYL